jgi:hypothetical protein
LISPTLVVLGLNVCHSLALVAGHRVSDKRTLSVA